MHFIRRAIPFALAAVVTATSIARAAETDALEAVAKNISEQIVEKPKVPAAMYARVFSAAVPTGKLAEIYCDRSTASMAACRA